MSSLIQIKRIRDIDGQIKICNIHKVELIEEYFNHIPLPRYEFRYQLGVDGKCEMPDCNRDAFCIMYHGEKQ